MFIQNVRMIEDVKKGKRILNPILYLFVGFVIYILGVIFSTAAQLYISFKVLSPKQSMEPIWSISIMLFCFIFMALLVMIFVRFVEKRPITSLGLYPKGWLKNLFFGVLSGFIAISVVIGIYAIIGCIYVDSPPTQPVGISALMPISILFVAFIVQSGTEELLSRGWLLNVISARYNKYLGIALSTFFFMMGHIYNSGFNFLVVINIVLFSVFLCLYVFKTNNLWVAIGFHGAWNFSIGNVYGMDVSGLKIGAGSIFDLSIKGNPIITGGVFGIEGSIIVSFVLVLAIIIISLIIKRSNNN